MLAAMRGESTDQIPWAPRMDLWYTALRARGTVPDRFAGMNTAEIADELGVGCHAVRADYTMDEPTFEAYMNELFDHLGTGTRLILGVSDNVPPDVNLARLERIQQWIDAFGAVQP